MADKFEHELNMGERFTLLAILPPPSDYDTYKILTKLRMSLAPDEKEIKEYAFTTLFRCPNKTFDEKGKASQCEWEGWGETAPKCPIHDKYCASAGQMKWTPEMAVKTKAIWMGNKARSLIVETIKKLFEDKDKPKTDMDISLYEKFILTDEEKDEEE